MKLTDYMPSFETLKRAFADGSVALLDCLDKTTGKPAAVIVAVHMEDGETSFTPFAMMFDEDPFERFAPPDPDKPGSYLGA